MSVLIFPSTQRSSGTVRSDCGFLASPSTLLAVSDLPARRPDNSVNGLGTDSVPRSQKLNSLRSSIKEGHLTGALIPDSVSLPFKGIAGASCRADLPSSPHLTSPGCFCSWLIYGQQDRKQACGICTEATKGSAGYPRYSHIRPLDLGQPTNPCLPGALRCGEAVCFSNAM